MYNYLNMEYENYIKLALTGLIPVVVSIILYFVDKKTKLNKIPYALKQAIIGIIFGLIAIAGTEYGTLINGAVMNARDAAPLCAGLIFGAPSGTIAGVIGGVERWFAVYWGAGSYTRLACTIATIFSGLFGALLRKYLFNDQTPNGVYGFATGLVAETLHMLMVFVTNMSDVKKAFSVVEICTIPMVSVNAISVLLATWIIHELEKRNNKEVRENKLTISSQFQRRLLVVVVVAYFITSGFTYLLQSSINEADTLELLSLNIEDVKKEITEKSDSNLLDITRKITSYLKGKELNNELIFDLLLMNGVSEINVVDERGIIIYSTRKEYIDFDMTKGEQSNEFMCLLSDADEFVQEYQTISYNSNYSMKYAGKKLEGVGFVQVGYDSKLFQDDIANELTYVAANRRIGETGSLLIVDKNYDVISASDPDLIGLNVGEAGLIITKDSIEGEVYSSKYEEQNLYYMFNSSEGFLIISILPSEEADFIKTLSIYLNTFMEILVFAGIFILTFFLVRTLVVLNIVKIDDSLIQITEGNLDTVVDANASVEFSSLSSGINDTVSKLKDYIKEANERIDAELKYAADIQHSVLPTEFPPFVDYVNNFDIYASMDPAREVGGDFYDFYLLNGRTLAFVVADVSGKGIPASLFMMRSKTLLKSYAEAGIAVADIFTNANFSLCEGNDAEMFVTAWMGFLDLKTGELKFANAGHNPPVIKRKDGTFEYLHSKAGFILGGMEGILYKEQETTLMPGDEIFVYTDGVVEATDLNKELYGEDRLLTALNNNTNTSSQELCEKIKIDVDKFVGEAPQFDDITMLSLKFKKFI